MKGAECPCAAEGPFLIPGYAAGIFSLSATTLPGAVTPTEEPQQGLRIGPGLGVCVSFKGKRTLGFLPLAGRGEPSPPKVTRGQGTLGTSRARSTRRYSPLKPTAMKRAAGDRLSDVAKYGKEIFSTTCAPAREAR